MSFKLSIITINYNNAIGLRKTLASTLAQKDVSFEHIIIDGGSSDSSIEIIKEYEDTIRQQKDNISLIWISEKDNGIYHAMNKGIERAQGDYCQFLNSGDCMYSDTSLCQQLAVLDNMATDSSQSIGVIYGNMIKSMPNGKLLHDRSNSERDVTFYTFYRGCLNHSPAFIRRDLFKKYGKYDESLKICSDWKWYVQSLILGGEKVEYSGVDMTLFDMTGISETNTNLLNSERERLCEELIPSAILADYQKHHFDIEQMNRLHRHPWAYKLVWFLERVLFKLEKHLRHA